jgi:methylmalonyl-CoA mutase, N-terminal domain
VVGVNAFIQDEPPPKNLLRVNEAVERSQAEALKQLRATRNAAPVTRGLDALRRAAQSEKENLVPLILEAVKAQTTLGEISDALRDVFGEHKEHVVL